MSNTITIYDLSDTQKELLHKIQDYLIKNGGTTQVEWTSPNSSIGHKVVHPLKKILRVLHNGYYDDKDKQDLNKLREFYMIYKHNI